MEAASPSASVPPPVIASSYFASAAFSAPPFVPKTGLIVSLSMNGTSSRLKTNSLRPSPSRPFTVDNYLSLQTDSLCAENGLEALGISPRDINAVVPLYLGGQAQRQRYQALRRPP